MNTKQFMLDSNVNLMSYITSGIDDGDNNIPQAEEMMYSNYMKQYGYPVSDIDIDIFKKGAEGSKKT
jgi:hypothetical protein